MFILVPCGMWDAALCALQTLPSLLEQLGLSAGAPQDRTCWHALIGEVREGQETFT